MNTGGSSWEEHAPVLTGVFLFFLYLSFPSHFFNFDGVACAIAVELSDFKHLVHGNHLLYGLTGWAFDRFFSAAGLRIGAIWSLQIMGMILGAAGAGFMCGLLRRRGFTTHSAVLTSAGMGLSHMWWFRALDAQVYVLALFFLVLCLAEALKERPSPYRLAMFHALAMLSHGAHALFAPAAVYALCRNRPEWAVRRADAARYLVTAAVIVIFSYLAAAVLWIRPSDTPEITMWLLGSAALGEGRTFHWLGSDGPVGAVIDWARAAAGIVSPWKLMSLPVWAAGLWALWKARRPKERPVVAIAALWLAAYPLLFLFYEPYKLDYHASDLVPLWLLVAVALERLRESGRTPFAAAFVAALGIVNFYVAIRPAANPGNNHSLQKALWIKESVPESAWVAALGLDEVYIPYFGHRRPLSLRYLKGSPTKLRLKVIDAVEAGSPVFVTSDLLTRDWSVPFSALNLRETSRNGSLVLYRVIP